jgi:DNA repair protein RadA/Sms
VFGEVGMPARCVVFHRPHFGVREAAQMGFTRCVVPEGQLFAEDVPPAIELVGVKSVSEALEQLIDW